MDWADIVDVEVSITLAYNPGGGNQQSAFTRAAVADWGSGWVADMQADWGADYRAGTKDMSENLACEIISKIWQQVAGLTLTKVVNFQGSVTLTYIKGTVKTKTNSIVPELAHLSNEMIAGRYDPASIKAPVQNVVRKWVATACDKCITDAGG